MKNTLLLITFSLFSIFLFAQIKESQAIDSIFIEWNKPDVPGCALGIIKDGKLIYSNGYGIADLEHDAAITPVSIFDIGSIYKHFVAFSILLLEEQGKLNLDDNIQKFLPDFPDYGAPLTIKHLLYHTHGVRGSLLYYIGRHGFNSYSSDAHYNLLKRQKELNFSPGEKFMYGNSGYFLLKRIVEKASGQSLRLYGQEHIFGPLGMENTLFYDNSMDIIKNRASSYFKENEEEGFNNLIIRSVGGVRTNIEDLALWDQNFYKNKLGRANQEIIQKMHEEDPIKEGWGLGIQKGNYRGLRTVGSAGSMAGFRAQLMRFPDKKFSVIILANRADANPTEMAYQVTDILLKSKFKSDSENEKAKTNTPVNTEAPKEFAKNQLIGSYELSPGRLVKITVENDTLQVFRTWDEFAYSVVRTVGNTYEPLNNLDLKLLFSKLEGGFAQNLTAFLNGREYVFKRKEAKDLTTLNLGEYTGGFYSYELDVSYLIFEEDGILKLKIAHYRPKKLSINGIDTFTFGRDLIRFKRLNGVITSFELDTDQAKNLKFEKK